MSIENNKNLVWSTIRVDKIDPEQSVYIDNSFNSAVVYFNQYDGLTIHLNLDQVDNLIDWAFSIKKAAAEKAAMADTNTTSSVWDL
jgi:hypothetical protein